MGFPGEPAKLGRLAEQKEYLKPLLLFHLLKSLAKRKFFKIDKEKVDTYKIGLTEENEEAYKKLTNEAPAGQIGRSVLNQMKKMKKYIFPPSFDFMNFDTDDVTPIAMYIFEFSHTLSQVDLQDIWQNLPPDIGTEMQVAEVAITHPLIKKRASWSRWGRRAMQQLRCPINLNGWCLKLNKEQLTIILKRRF